MHYNLNKTACLQWMKNIYMGVDAYLLYFDDLCKNIIAQCKWFPRPLCNVLSKKVIHYKAGDYVGLNIFLMDENVIAMDSVAWRFPIWLVPTYLAMGIIRCVGTILDSKSGNNMICKTGCQKWPYAVTKVYIAVWASITHTEDSEIGHHAVFAAARALEGPSARRIYSQSYQQFCKVSLHCSKGFLIV